MIEEIPMEENIEEFKHVEEIRKQRIIIKEEKAQYLYEMLVDLINLNESSGRRDAFILEYAEAITDLYDYKGVI
jgi:hypothetical protein